MIALVVSQETRSVDRVIQLDRERLDWTSRYIEWDGLGFEPEAQFALENLRATRRRLRRAFMVASFWSWLSRTVSW